MDEKILSKLKLNKQNVASLLLSCKATSQTPPNKVRVESFYSRENSTRKAPLINLDGIKVHDSIDRIKYLLGQLKIVHDRTDPFTPAQGIFDYTGNKWTDDNNALFALYYLATSSSVLPYFVDGKKYAEARNMTLRYNHGLIPTYPPDDPRFNINDAKRALKELGVELPEGQDYDDK